MTDEIPYSIPGMRWLAPTAPRKRRHRIPMMEIVMMPDDEPDADALRDRIAENQFRNRRLLSGIQED